MNNGSGLTKFLLMIVNRVLFMVFAVDCLSITSS